MGKKQHPAAEAAKKFDEDLLAAQAVQAPAEVPPAGDAGIADVVGGAPAAPVVEPAIDWQARAREAEQYAEQIRRDVEGRAQAEIERRAQEAATLAQQLREAQEANLRMSGELDAINFERATHVDFNGLEHIDPEVARELSDKMFRPMLQSIEQRLKTTYEKRIEDLSRGMTERDERMRNDRNARMNAKIRSAHADIDTFGTNPAFNDFRASRIPGTRTTYGEQLAAAYNEGDAAFVVELLDAFKARGQSPASTLAAIAGAPSGGAASSVASQPVSAPAKMRYDEIGEWQAARRRGDISREEFAKRMDAFKKAEAAGLVE